MNTYIMTIEQAHKLYDMHNSHQRLANSTNLVDFGASTAAWHAFCAYAKKVGVYDALDAITAANNIWASLDLMAEAEKHGVTHVTITVNPKNEYCELVQPMERAA